MPFRLRSRRGSWGHCSLSALGAALVLGALSDAKALTVRVLVSSGQQVTVRVPVTPTPTSPLVAPSVLAGLPQPQAMNTWVVGTSGRQPGAHLTLGGQDAGNTALYLPPAPGSVVEINGRFYRGGVLLRAQDGGVQAINVVDVEDYLRGVVPAEMPSGWPVGALAAQAVIARTYVAARINPAAPYDTCATESCQVYRGMDAEKPGTDAAIAATASQVIAYGGKPASTYFSSDSGGFTASSAEVWGKEIPYLAAKADPFSTSGPRSRWRLEVPLSKVQTVASQFGVKVGDLRSVSVTRVSESGRPQEITLSGAAGVARISGAQAGGFVRALGAMSSRATLSGLSPLIVEGSGAGHGVGLSQYGALELARQGYDYMHVLGFYYPGTTLNRLARVREGAGPVLAGGRPLPAPALRSPPEPSFPEPAGPSWLAMRAGPGVP
ncbi:SpoIID/LytB domain-containing protein [Deinococcus deserti]|uniref:Putative SpoIID/LytB domain protein n=1 Tax=Deinococcus deserti (strain DSM 17065 / CIP 109153 / LMG 22923 / VCD115) TaxID=546414 RepID=C1D013_DEIDV|nr:SpoIID/LytB domain-containing protein [Deinococcus deserti]ACO45265.1 putative SpoIID/LytB domain protein [Deinococcus deserti VCD115]